MVRHLDTRNARLLSYDPNFAAERDIEPVQAAEAIFRKFGPRAISLLTNPRALDDGRTLPPRHSANDCYVAMEESCRKMARVALRKYQADGGLQAMGFSAALDAMFPDPAAYLTRCIRSVISDAERLTWREAPAVSLDQPLAGLGGDAAISLGDTLRSDDENGQPEAAFIAKDERQRFRAALSGALKAIPANYLAALERDMARERERQDGAKVSPETDRERQTICRARAALSEILKRECGSDNPFARLLAQQRSSRVRQKKTPSPNWTAERQSNLFQRLLSSSWQERSADAGLPNDNVVEAVINETNCAANVAPPSPEMRAAMRVMDTYTLGDKPLSQSPEAQEFYAQARQTRQKGHIEEAIQLYRAAYAADPRFFAAHNEVGVLLMQSGNLREALDVYVAIVERPDAGSERYLAANNAADVYLHWFDAGRNRERNIERATYYAQFAMQMPTPMRACNLILAYVKDKYYREAQQVMDMVLHSALPECGPEKFLQTLFQIRDADLVIWWNWLDGELGKEN